MVRNERIKDSWALLETQKGDIHMTLDWRPIVVDANAELLEAGDQREVEQERKHKEAEEKRFASAVLPSLCLRCAVTYPPWLPPPDTLEPVCSSGLVGVQRADDARCESACHLLTRSS